MSSTSSLSTLSKGARKLKLLCLHGYMQNASHFSSKIGSMRKGLKSRCEFEFVDSPYEVQSDESEIAATGGTREGARCWWRWSSEGQIARPSLSTEYLGFRSSLETVVEAIERVQPDGLLGFSMGGTSTCMVLSALSLLSTGSEADRQRVADCLRPVPSSGETPEDNLLYLQRLSDKIRSGQLAVPRFGIAVGAFCPYDATFKSMLAAAVPTLPVLFVSGDTDPLVPRERTLQIAEFFPNHRLFTHPSGHLVPTCSGEFKAELVSFMEGVPEADQLQAAAEKLAAVSLEV